MSIAPISSVEQPEAIRPARASIGREVLFALLAAVVVAGLGAPFGLLWSKLAPHVELVQTQYGPYPIDGEPEGYWADDGWFILMAIGMGVLVAVAAWFLLRRYRGPLLLAGLVLGSAAASVIGAWLGNKIGWAHYLDLAQHAPENTHIFRPVKLRTGTSSLAFGFLPWVRGTMLIQSLAAAAVYTGLAGFHVSPTLRYDNIPPEYLTPPPPPGAAYEPYPAPPTAGYQPYPVPGAPYPPPGAQPYPGGPAQTAQFPAHPGPDLGGPAQAAQFSPHPGPHSDGPGQGAQFAVQPESDADGQAQGPQFAAQPEPRAGSQAQGPQFAAQPHADGQAQGQQFPGQSEPRPSASGPAAQPVSGPPPTGSPWETAPTWTDPGAPPPAPAPAAPLWPSSDTPSTPPSPQPQSEPPQS